MKKIFLKIKNPGIMFKLGNKKFRSPVEIDVTHLKVDNIISQMKTYGIIDFEITTNEISTSSKEKNKSNITYDKEIEKLNLKIDQMEKVLKELLNQNKREQNNIESKKIKETQIDIKPEVKPKIQSQSQPQLQPVQKISKKVVIEELEELVEEPKFNFITKDFKLGIVDPFMTLSDIDQLKILKKK